MAKCCHRGLLFWLLCYRKWSAYLFERFDGEKSKGGLQTALVMNVLVFCFESHSALKVAADVAHGLEFYELMKAEIVCFLQFRQKHHHGERVKVQILKKPCVFIYPRGVCVRQDLKQYFFYFFMHWVYSILFR